MVVEASKETKTDSKTGITFAKGSSKPSATGKVTKTDSIYNAVKKSASALRAIDSLTLDKPDGSSLFYTITGAETHGGAPGKANAVAFYSARGDVINVTATSLNVTKEDGTIVMTDTIVAEKSRRRRLMSPFPPWMSRGGSTFTSTSVTDFMDAAASRFQKQQEENKEELESMKDVWDRRCKSTEFLKPGHYYCTPLTVCKYYAGEYESVAPTKTSDRECARGKPPPRKEQEIPQLKYHRQKI